VTPDDVTDGSADEFVDARLRDRVPTTPVAAARRRYGVVGAALAGAMIALRDVFEKPKDDQAVVVDAPSDPKDMDDDGITVPLADGTAAHSPARPRPPADPDVARAWARRQVERNRRG
jgi:hypothetical protein